VALVFGAAQSEGSMIGGDRMKSVARVKDQPPTLFAPEEAKQRKAIIEAGVVYAAKMQDWERLDVAIDEMIEFQKEFRAWWQDNVGKNWGGDRGKSADRRTCLPLEEAEKKTGIRHQQVSKWNERLVNEDDYRALLFATAQRKAMALRGQSDQRGASGTGENEWFTPAEHIERARLVLGGIDLDPATHKKAQETVRAERWFTKATNGLVQEWHGRVWLNPPYAQPHIADFVSKMVSERKAGRVAAAIMLTHNYTDTAWFHEAVSIADAICFTRGRVKFYEPNGKIAAPTQGQAFFYFGSDVEAFTRTFCAVGFVVFPVRNSDAAYQPSDTGDRVLV
jgi:phage N-6-adenine-methyltransferase